MQKVSFYTHIILLTVYAVDSILL